MKDDSGLGSVRFEKRSQEWLVLPAITAAIVLVLGGIGIVILVLKHATTIAACLRNAPAVAAFLREQAGPIAIIAAGERWPDDTLRPAWEDLIAAGAIITELSGARSPEAAAAAAAFQAAKPNLADLLEKCSSGRELIERGFATDVDLAAAYDVSRSVPVLRDGAFLKLLW